MKIIKYIFFVIIFMVIQYNKVICDDPCGSMINCPSGINYPYIICCQDQNEPDSKVICVQDPYDVNNKNLYCHGNNIHPPKINLPICTAPVVDSIPQSVEIPPGNCVFSRTLAIEEMEDAAYEWNCLCDKQDDDCNDGCIIRVLFSEDPSYFQEPLIDLAVANTYYARYYCTVYCDMSYIVFNNTDAFTLKAPGTPRNFFINQDYIDQNTLDAVSANNSRVYSFYDIMLHELGHILGFADNYECDPPIDGIMNGYADPVTSTDDASTGLNIYDKCMFIKLYCPELVPVKEMPKEEYEEISECCYPSPISDFSTFSFRVQANSYVSLKIYNSIGQIISIPIVDRLYDIGSYKEILDFSNVSSGIYMIVLQVGEQVDYRKAVVIK